MSRRMPERLVRMAASERWHMFPLIPGTKRPAVKGWETAAQVPVPDESIPNDVSGSREMIVGRNWPGRDNGIACGPTGWVVIDLDTSLTGAPEGIDSLLIAAAGREIPRTRTHKTRSGGWQLVYLAIPGREIRNSAGRIGPKVDVRGAPGYVVAPGSYVAADKKPGGWYKIDDPRPPVPLPEWIAALLDPPPPPPSVRSPTLSRPGGGPWRGKGHGSPRARLIAILGTVIDAPVGTRNNVLFWAARRAAEMAEEGFVDRAAAMVAVEEAGMRAGLGQGECRLTVASAFRRKA